MNNENITHIRRELLELFITNSLLPDAISIDSNVLLEANSVFIFDDATSKHEFLTVYTKNKALQTSFFIEEFLIGIDIFAQEIFKRNLKVENFNYKIIAILSNIKNQWIFNKNIFYIDFIVQNILFAIKPGYGDEIIPLISDFIMYRNLFSNNILLLSILNVIFLNFGTNNDFVVSMLNLLPKGYSNEISIEKFTNVLSSNTVFYSNNGNVYRKYFENNQQIIELIKKNTQDEGILNFFSEQLVNKYKYFHFDGVFLMVINNYFKKLNSNYSEIIKSQF